MVGKDRQWSRAIIMMKNRIRSGWNTALEPLDDEAVQVFRHSIDAQGQLTASPTTLRNI